MLAKLENLTYVWFSLPIAEVVGFFVTMFLYEKVNENDPGNPGAAEYGVRKADLAGGREKNGAALFCRRTCGSRSFREGCIMKRRSIEGMEKTLPRGIVGMSHPVIAQITEDDTVRREEKPGFRLLDELWEMGTECL